MENTSNGELGYDVKGQWDSLAEEYGIGVLAQKHILFPGIVREYLPTIVAGTKVLDIGCGDGMYSNLIKTQQEAQVVGVDLSPEMIAKAQAKYPNIEFKVGKVEDVAETFDHVFANMLLCNIPKQDLKNFFDSVRAVLNLGGVLAFTNVAPDFQKTCHTKYLNQKYPKRVHDGCQIQVELHTINNGVIGPFKNYHYSSDFLVHMAETAGFKMSKIIDLQSQESIDNTPVYRLFIFTKL